MNLDTVKSKIADFGHSALDSVEESFNDGKHALMDTTEHMGKDISHAADKAVHGIKYSDAVKTLGNVAAAVTSARVIGSFINPERGYRWFLDSVGLQRKPSVFSRIGWGTGFILCGAAVGAGVAMLLSPKSGPENRDYLYKGYQGIRRDAEKTVKSLESKAQDIMHNVEKQATDVVHNVEDKARNLTGNNGSPSTENTASSVGGGTSMPRRRPDLAHRAPRG